MKGQIFVVFHLFLSFVLVGQTDTAGIEKLSLQDLVNLDITVASKNSEKIGDAPGVITAYDANDVERYGYYTLKDLSNITSGYSSFSAYGETNLETRGKKAGSWNVSKHLVLIDGIPVNHARANSAPMENQLPLFFADNIEFLKGPGSALYGNSAFYGVMNLKSKELKEYGTMVETKFSYIPIGDSRRLLANFVSSKEIGDAKLFFGYFSKGFTGDSLGINNSAFHFNNDNSFFFNSSYSFTNHQLKGLKLGIIYMSRNSHGGEFWGATPSPVNQTTWEELIPFIKYDKDLINDWSLKSYVKYNGSRELNTFGASWNTLQPNSVPFSGFNYLVGNYELLGELKYEISEKSNFIFGVNMDTRKEESSPNSYGWDILIPDTTRGTNFEYMFLDYDGTVRVNIASAYSQYRNEFDVLKGLVLTAGARIDQGFSSVGSYNQFSPRIGVVQKLTENLNIKALYGQALRSPGVKEIGLNAETIEKINENGGNGNADDIPEVFAEASRTIEGAINFNKGGLSLSLAAFQNFTYGALDGTQYNYTASNGDSIAANYFINLNGDIAAKGFELDAQYAFNRNFRLMVNHAYAKASHSDTVDFVDVPTHKTNAALTFVLPGKFNLSTTIIFRNVSGFVVDSVEYNSPNLDFIEPNILKGYNLLDANFLIPLTQGFSFEFQVRNILDTKWKQPSLLGVNSMIPIEGRSFLLTVARKF